MQHRSFVIILRLVVSGRFAGFEKVNQLLEKIALFREILVDFGILADSGVAALEHFKICENQFQIDGLNVTDRVNAAVHMDNVRVLKAADDMDDGIAFTDIGKELVAKAFTLGSALDQSGNIDELDRGRNRLGRIIHLRQHIETVVRNGDNTDIRIDCAERIIRGFCTGAGQ